MSEAAASLTQITPAPLAQLTSEFIGKRLRSLSLIELVELAELLAPFAREKQVRSTCSPLLGGKRLVDPPHGKRWLPIGSSRAEGGGDGGGEGSTGGWRGGGGGGGGGGAEVAGAIESAADRLLTRRRQRRNTLAGGESIASAAEAPVVHDLLQSFVALESWGDGDEGGDDEPAPPPQDELSKLHSRVLKHLLLRFPTTINKIGRKRTRSLLGPDLFAARLRRESEMKQARAEMRRVGRVCAREKPPAEKSQAVRCDDRESPSFGVLTYPLEALKRGVAWPE